MIESVRSRKPLATAVTLAACAALPLATAADAQASTPSVTAQTAGTKTVGATTYVWGTVSNVPAGTRVCDQVLLSSGWSQSQCGTTSDNGAYALKLTYGATTPGTYTFRVVSAGATSSNVTLRRVPSTGTHTNEPVVASAASGNVPNRFVTSFPAVTSASPGSNVLALTHLLRGAGVGVTPSSTYSAEMTRAVRAYQHRYGLPETGTADASTVAALATTLSSGTTSARTQALKALLSRHGYPTDSSSMAYGPQTNAQVRAFQAGHGIVANSFVGNRTWATLFGAKTSGPIFPQLQAGTGTATQWSNCGPVSAVVLELYRSVSVPKWTGDPAANEPAVNYFRFVQAQVPNTPTYNKAGTTYRKIVPALGKVGISAYPGSNAQMQASVRAGHPAIAGGDAYQLPWNRTAPSYVSGPASHFIAVLGWDGTHFIVVDPISTPSKNTVHLLTPAQLTTFGATAPGWGPGELGNDVPPSENNIMTR